MTAEARSRERLSQPGGLRPRLAVGTGGPASLSALRALRGALLGVVLLLLLLLFVPAADAAGSGTIEGRVTSASGGAAIEGIEVCAVAIDEQASRCGLTDFEGEYALTGLAPGEYIVEFAPPFESALDYVPQYYNNQPSFFDADPVTVAADGVSSGIDASLATGAEIEGRVTGAASSAPLEGVEVCAEKTGFGFFLRCAVTNATGHYLIAGLATGSYRVLFFTELNYVMQYYNNKVSAAEATTVALEAPDTRTGIDAALATGGEIAGRVSNAATSAAIGGTLVCASLLRGEELFGERCATTNAGGEYTIVGLAGGAYAVAFTGLTETPGVTYVTQYYHGEYVSSEAQLVAVMTGGLTSGIDAALERGPRKAPVDTGPPVVSGTPTVGDVLSCSNGSWSAVPAPTFAYQWLRNGVPISGATASTYQVQGADEGHSVACEVTAKNFVGKAGAISVSVAIAAMPPPPPPPAPAVAIVSSKLALAAHAKLLRVKLQCAHAACNGEVELTVQVLARRRKRGRTVSRKTAVVLGKGSFSLAEGEGAGVVVKLTATGRARLAHVSRRRPVEAKILVSVNGGATVTRLVRLS